MRAEGKLTKNFGMKTRNMKNVNFVPKEEEVFCKKTVLKNLLIFTEKHLEWSLFFNKNAGLQGCNFIKKRLQHWRFLANIAKFLRALILKHICGQLLLRVFSFMLV